MAASLLPAHRNARQADGHSGGAVLTWGWTGEDRLRLLTVGAMVIVAAAPIMALAGIPPVPLMWPMYRLGVVLPTCGLTRGVVALASGDPGAAWRWNPASLPTLVIAVGGVVRLAVGAATGRWLDVRVRPRWWLVGVAVVLTAALWAHQQGHADLLMAP